MDDVATTFLTLGRIVAPRGIDGELKVDLQATDAERFAALERVYLGPARAPHAVLRARLHQGQGLLLLEGIADRDSAETWRDALVYVAAEDAPPLAPDEYLVDDIIGLRVVTAEGEPLGVVSEVITTPGNDVYVVHGLSEVLLPAIKSVVLTIDLPARLMSVKLPDGLR